MAREMTRAEAVGRRPLMQIRPAAVPKERDMSSASVLLHGVTEAHGSYNKNAASQAAGGALARPLVEKAARELALDPGDAPIVALYLSVRLRPFSKGAAAKVEIL
jgi:hypothetical protein